MGHEKGRGFVVAENRIQGLIRIHRSECEQASLGRRTMEHTSWYSKGPRENYASYGDAYFKALDIHPTDEPLACPSCIPPGTISERFPWLTKAEEDRYRKQAIKLLKQNLDP